MTNGHPDCDTTFDRAMERDKLERIGWRFERIWPQPRPLQTEARCALDGGCEILVTDSPFPQVCFLLPGQIRSEVPFGDCDILEEALPKVLPWLLSLLRPAVAQMERAVAPAKPLVPVIEGLAVIDAETA